MMEKAKESITVQEVSERLVGSETVAFDPEDLPEAEVILREAIKKLSALARRGKKRREVYHMGVQFFRVTQNKSNI